MAKNTGTEYENFVKIIQETILNLSNSDLSPTKHITIERNKIIHDKNEIAREFDLYWEFEYGRYQYCSVIECKDYASKVSIEKIDAFLGKTIDIPGLRLIYATKTGYQSGALTKDGIPLIRQIICTMIIKPIQIKSMNFEPDISWFTL
ncbi:unnamed protein product [Commensalibacter communis]|uniref:hypothetical protein n=1 Tax=Commensalibacter communis TaxID=2972786 RepID=UPI0022FF6CA4|nr:hypothetical protein [Commensalibacter communis]CAI3941611.1 unnamed protein product [Commensalibacter communis]